MPTLETNLQALLTLPAAKPLTRRPEGPRAGQHPATVSAEIKAAAHAAAASGCDDSLWQHVYHPTRLKVVEKCIQITGTIHHI
jgi:hypothetical protein